MNLQNTAPRARINPRILWRAILALVVLELALVAIPPTASAWGAAADWSAASISNGANPAAPRFVPVPTPPSTPHHMRVTPMPSYASPAPRPQPVQTPLATEGVAAIGLAAH